MLCATLMILMAASGIISALDSMKLFYYFFVKLEFVACVLLIGELVKGRLCYWT